VSQEHYWKEFYRLKVHVIYVEQLLAETEIWDRCIKMFSAIASSASIGAWVVWKEYAFLWGTLIAASQVLNAIRQYLPYKDRLRCYAGLRSELEELLLGVEARWLEIANGECTEAAIRRSLADLRARRQKAFNKHLPNATVPENVKALAVAEERTSEYFQNFYPEGESDEQQQPSKATEDSASGGEAASGAKKDSTNAKDSTSEEVKAGGG